VKTEVVPQVLIWCYECILRLAKMYMQDMVDCQAPHLGARLKSNRHTKNIPKFCTNMTCSSFHTKCFKNCIQIVHAVSVHKLHAVLTCQTTHSSSLYAKAVTLNMIVAWDTSMVASHTTPPK
jgi:hypothetical protein